ncbi:MAG: hypothetical protein AAF517_08505 [Planctomycetota bacterium]
MGSDRFFIRTKSGQKGPFSREKLKKYVEAGKIPESLRVYTDEGVAVLVSEILAGTEAAEAADSQADSRTGEPAPAPLPRTKSWVEAAPSPKPPRPPQPGEGGAKRSRRRARPPAPPVEHDFEDEPRQKKKSPLMILLTTGLPLALGLYYVISTVWEMRGLDLKREKILAKAQEKFAPKSGDPVLDGYVEFLVAKLHFRCLEDATTERKVSRGRRGGKGVTVDETYSESVYFFAMKRRLQNPTLVGNRSRLWQEFVKESGRSDLEFPDELDIDGSAQRRRTVRERRNPRADPKLDLERKRRERMSLTQNMKPDQAVHHAKRILAEDPSDLLLQRGLKQAEARVRNRADYKKRVNNAERIEDPYKRLADSF